MTEEKTNEKYALLIKSRENKDNRENKIKLKIFNKEEGYMKYRKELGLASSYERELLGVIRFYSDRSVKDIAKDFCRRFPEDKLFLLEDIATAHFPTTCEITLAPAFVSYFSRKK